ncbi:MAG: transposase family protein, partial [Dactylosporangium sp.]|nr:transposase family protein [Dactylosporangium sp.]
MPSGGAGWCRLVQAVAAGGEVPADVARLVRVVDYTVPDRNPAGELITVITTILDPHELSGVDLATAYHDRWEEESALNEIKSDLRGRGCTCRKSRPRRSRSMLVLVEDAAEAIASSDVEAGQLVRIGD